MWKIGNVVPRISKKKKIISTWLNMKQIDYIRKIEVENINFTKIDGILWHVIDYIFFFRLTQIKPGVISG